MSMSVGGSRRGGAIAEINVTPMADIMIVLLIIFMVTAPLIVNAPVALPDAHNARDRNGERIEVLVRKDGSIAVGGSTLPDEMLTDYLAARGTAQSRTTVLVQADRGAAYADVARALRACRAADVDEIALAAQLQLGH